MKILAYINQDGSNQFTIYFTLDGLTVQHCIAKNFHSVGEMLSTTPRIPFFRNMHKEGFRTNETTIDEFQKTFLDGL